VAEWALPVLCSSADVLRQSALLFCEAEAILVFKEHRDKDCAWLCGAKK